MIATSNIYQSIKTVLENHTDATVQIKDIKTPTPPCYYIKYINGVDRLTATDYVESSISFEVIYFSAEKTLTDLMEQEILLKQLFSKPLKIEYNESAIYQEIDNITISFNEDDYILNCKLEFNINQCVTDSESVDIINRYDEFENDEYMDELEI